MAGYRSDFKLTAILAFLGIQNLKEMKNGPE